MYLRRLNAEYVASGRTVLAKILEAARILTIEATEHDNWNGGVDGHDVRLFVPLDVLGTIKVQKQRGVSEELLKDLNACADAVPHERFRAVQLELSDENDPDYQRAVPLSQRPPLRKSGLRWAGASPLCR